jgi:hypothetical protein
MKNISKKKKLVLHNILNNNITIEQLFEFFL